VTASERTHLETIVRIRGLTEATLRSVVSPSPCPEGRDGRDFLHSVNRLPLPFVFHARIATIGGVRAELCHPFPLDLRLRATRLDGMSRKGVLFHNGHWPDWQRFVTPAPNDRSPWSDSRAMALIAGKYGADVIEEIVPDSQRVVLFTPDGVRRLGAGWTETRRGVFASNQHWTRCLRVRGPLQLRFDEAQEVCCG
jgi:hypothetical protein